MKQKLAIAAIGILLALTVLYGAGTTINGARTILNSLTIGTDNSAAGTLQLANGSANAHTIWASGATTSNTIAGFATAPTTGHLVTCTTSGTTCTLTDGGASSSGLVLVQQHTANNTATSISFPSTDTPPCFSSTYDEYEIEFLNLIPATDNVSFFWRASTDGTTYDSGNNYAWDAFRYRAGGSGVFGGTAQAQVDILGGNTQKNTSTLGTSGHLKIFSPASTALHKFVLTDNVVSFDSSSNQTGSVTTGRYVSTTAILGFQIVTSSGNITSGTVRCYGIAK